MKHGIEWLVHVVPPSVDPETPSFVGDPSKLLLACYTELFRAFFDLHHQ